MIRLAKSLALAATATAAMAVAAPAAQARVQTGTLVCDVSAGIGMIVASKKTVSCTFKPVKGRGEIYVGTITKFGLDVGVTSAGTIVWAVFEPGTHRNSLGGTYVGATAEATVGAGLGANVLVGGSNKSVALQPVSVSGQAGLNLAAGVGELLLRPAH